MAESAGDATEAAKIEEQLQQEFFETGLAVTEEGPVITEAFIIDEDKGTLVSSQDVLKSALQNCMRCFDTDLIHREADNVAAIDVAKTVSGSTQSDREIGADNQYSLAGTKVVEPPYPPRILAMFLEVDETHYRCVRTKATDAVLREYVLEPTVPVRPEEAEGDVAEGDLTPDPTEETDKNAVAQSVIDEEVAKVKAFIEDCNEIDGFEGVLERGGLDYESVGWAALEVIRSRDGQIRKLAHIPAERVRVLRGFKGFVEIVGDEKFIYYQPFGQKVVSKTRKNPITNEAEPYNPRQDGDLSLDTVEWRMVDRKTGEPTSNFNAAANELVWLPKRHPSTIYYGMGDVVPALGYVLGNVHIRDFQLQFFEHNTVPRYAVVIEGAKLSEPVKELITEYFKTQVKGKAHKTLVIPVPALRGEVKVRFEKLDADVKESSFIESKKANAQGIMTAHGVSPAVIGIAEHSELGSGKGLSQAEIYKDRIVSPVQRFWGRAITTLFRLGLGVRTVALKFTPLDIRDEKAEQEVLTGYQEKGAATINEVRKRAGLGDPISGGDRAFIVVPGQGVMFVDEMTQAASAKMEDLQGQVDSMTQEAQMRKLAGQTAGPPRLSGPPNGKKPPQPVKRSA